MHAATRFSIGISPARFAETRAFRARRAGAVASRARQSGCRISASSKPTLYDIPVSNNGARVRLLLYWKGLERDFRIENPSVLGGLKSEVYLELNPQGKMPLLVVPSPERSNDGDGDGDVSMALPESEVIAQYVLHKYAEKGPSLIPKDPNQRALASLVTRIHDVYIAPIQGCMYRGPMPVEKRAEDLHTVAKQMDVVERVLADAADLRRNSQSQSLKSGNNDGQNDGPFVCGLEPCFADAALFPTYVFLERILPRYFGWDDVFDKRPLTKKWWIAMCGDECGARVLGEIRKGLDDWHDAGRWETTGVLEAVKDDMFTWKY